MKLSKKTRTERKVYIPEEIRERTITEFVYKPVDLSLAKKYFPDLFKDSPKQSSKTRLKPKK